MNRCIYCDDNISLWGNKDALYNVYIMNNKTKKIIADISAGYMDEYMRGIEYRLINRYINNRLKTLKAG